LSFGNPHSWISSQLDFLTRGKIEAPHSSKQFRHQRGIVPTQSRPI
jgi:hypothetical protein